MVELTRQNLRISNIHNILQTVYLKFDLKVYYLILCNEFWKKFCERIYHRIFIVNGTIACNGK